MRPTILALCLLCAAAPLARAAAATRPAPAAPAAAAMLGPATALPKNFSVDMKIHADGKDFTMTRYANENGDSRMDIDMPEQGRFTMIQLNDEKKTMYTVMPEKKQVIKQSMTTAMESMAGKHEPRATAPDSAAHGEGTIELVGQEDVNGIHADKYKVTNEGMSGFLWVDPATHLVSRMQAENGTVDFTNYKANATTAEALTPPKDYKLTDMDEMMAKMKGMGGMSGMAQSMMGGMAGGMGSSLGSSLGGQAGGALGGMLGGPLGRMAGTYLGNKLGSKLGSKAGSAAASKL
jgi:hypothetical protein